MTRLTVGLLCALATACGRIGIDPVDVATSLDSPDAAVAMEDPYLAAVLADHPIALWRFEDEGQLAYPDVGPRAAEIQGDAKRVLGIDGRALAFDGQSTRMPLVGVDSVASVEMWVRPTIRDTHVRFLLDGSIGSDRISLFARDQFTMAARSLDGVSHGVAAGPVLSMDAFTHLVVTYADNYIEVFVDGVVYEGSLDTAFGAGGAFDLVVGDTLAGSFYKLAAVVDDLAVYRERLPLDRVLAHRDARH